jgi:hypothetical protein
VARPKLPAHLKPSIERTIRMTPGTFDLVFKIATVQGVSMNQLLQRTVERVFTHQTIRERYESCYGALQRSSTLTSVVSESSTRRTADAVSDRGDDARPVVN